MAYGHAVIFLVSCIRALAPNLIHGVGREADQSRCEFCLLFLSASKPRPWRWPETKNIIDSLLNFDHVLTPEKCCNRPKIVAILEIATLFSLGGVAGACVGKALDNAFLLSVAKCVLDLQHVGVAT